jgi:hypothetical protein
MNLKINQFQELRGVEVTFPAIIKGRNGAGKSTIKRALAYVLNQNNPETGKTFGNEVYPLNPTTAADIYAEVVLEGVGFTLTRRSEPTAQQREKWQKGDQLSVVNVCKLNGIPVKVAEYQQNVDALTKGLDIDSLLKDPKKMRAFLVRLSGLGEYDERPLKEERAKLEKQRKDIETAEAIVRDYDTRRAEYERKRAEIDNPRAQIAIAENELNGLREKARQISEKIADAQPTLTDSERKINDEINTKIIEIERATPDISPAPQLVLLPRLSSDYSGYENEISSLKSIPAPVADVQLTAEAESHLAKANEYDERAAAAETSEKKCQKCAICTAVDNCPDCVVVGGTPDEWRAKAAAERAAAADLNAVISDKLAMDESEHRARLERLAIVESELANLKEDESARNAEIDEENNRRRAEYEEAITHYNATHEKEVSAWVAEKNAKIADLRAQIIVPVFVDVTDKKNKLRALNELITMKETDLKSMKAKEREVADIDAAIETLKINADANKATLADMRTDLIVITANVETLKASRRAYYENLEKTINAILPTDITVALFRENISNSDVTECCDLYFRGKSTMSGAEALVFKATLSQALQRVAGVDLPIIIDEAANVVNADLLSELSATGCTLLIPDAAAENLTITQL